MQEPQEPLAPFRKRQWHSLITKQQQRTSAGKENAALSTLSKQRTYYLHRRKSRRKHLVLALALTAGAWCLFSLTLIFSNGARLTDSKIDFSQHPHHFLVQKQARSRNDTIPQGWSSSQALQHQQHDFLPPFGFTMRDLARRILSRYVAKSHVLVVAPDAQQALHYKLPVNGSLDSVEFDASKQSLGATFMLHAKSQGHTTHALNAGLSKSGESTPWNTTLGTWWSYYDSSSKQTRPNWILLAVVYPGFGWEDLVWRDSSRFLQDSTITYIVTAVRSRFVNQTLEVHGIQGANALLKRRYKMQVLQASHYHVEFDGGNDKQQSPTTFQQYGPNALLKTELDIEALLLWGAQAIQRYTTGTNSNATTKTSPVFTAYLFGTQGLDLAIPSRRHYIRDDSRITGDESWTQINLYKPLQFYSCPMSKGGLSVDISFDKVFETRRLHALADCVCMLTTILLLQST